ncbi:NADPH-dependent glutamate synthase [Allobaculum stercoricanis]|uniref:NADPH-dependent glutamate synthase n=1 Tax=Allobaculum stercoricanis TaxID=174709 RepID=UPI0003A5F667|nr:NADPH-dependent glutamate synthase [Allobaculum stercoricanis]
MPNMRMDKNPMPAQDPNVRITNVEEVTLGYTPETAIDEAKRCLNCKHKPCVEGCPVNIHIPDFIAKVAEGDFAGAYEIISLTSSLPAICGRVCPQETQCESKCVRGIKGEPVAIGRLERFVADYMREQGEAPLAAPQRNGHKVAIVGGGPAGLTAAGDLAKLGYQVTVFEALHVAGGVLMYGIPEFRLPKSIVQHEISKLSNLGVEFVTNYIVGRSGTIEDLESDGYEAIFVGSGAGLPNFMNMPGEELKGVYSANEFLTRFNLMKAYKDDSDTPIQHPRKTVVVGGGNVAMDAARCARRLGSEVHVVYRRSLEELPARKEEVEHAMEEGIIFDLLNNPVEVHPDENGNVASVECIKMELGEPDESGRRRPIAKEGSNFLVEADCMIMAIGTSPNPLIRSTTEGLETNRKGCLIVDENEMTSRQGIFAGGDAVTGAATVISAMGAGKKSSSSNGSIRPEKSSRKRLTFSTSN